MKGELYILRNEHGAPTDNVESRSVRKFRVTWALEATARGDSSLYAMKGKRVDTVYNGKKVVGVHIVGWRWNIVDLNTPAPVEQEWIFIRTRARKGKS